MRGKLATVLCLSTLTAMAQKPQPTMPVDLDAPYVPVHTDSHACVDSDWDFLSQPTTTNLLGDYGFELTPPSSCVAAVVPWLPNARIIRLHESLRLDDYRTVTIAQGSPSARVWIIPIEFGMVGYPDTVNNPHHIAAFNDMLHFASRKPDENLLFELGNLYQFMVGMEEWFDPAHAPKTIRDALKINDVMGMMEVDSKGITLKHREPNGDSWTHTYLVWEFYSSDQKAGCDYPVSSAAHLTPRLMTERNDLCGSGRITPNPHMTSGSCTSGRLPARSLKNPAAPLAGRVTHPVRTSRATDDACLEKRPSLRVTGSRLQLSLRRPPCPESPK